ncbi:hypothetical protein Hanom_Chr14g01321271 [Helianthus anomalus]
MIVYVRMYDLQGCMETHPGKRNQMPVFHIQSLIVNPDEIRFP